MEIYARPANTFVARFVGSPAMNLIPVGLVPGDGPSATVLLGDGAVVETRVPREGLAPEGLQLGLRPETVRVAREGDAATSAKVVLVERLGERSLIYGTLADGQAITAEDSGLSEVRIGDTVGLRILGHAAHLFDADGAGHHARDGG